MPYFEFIWTQEIETHLAEHGVSPDDFEQVVCDPVSKGVSRSSGLPCVWGYATDGRYLLAVYEQLDDMRILLATAYQVPEPA
jgi:hypothetical protein